MSDTTNNPRISKFDEVRLTASMQRVEANIQLHYKEATKSVKLLRADFLTAHSLLSEAGCAGQFSAWLQIMKIPRATAYYILGKKNSKGEFADTGTGKWGAEPKKPLTAKQKKAAQERRNNKASKAFNGRLKQTLVSKGPQGAREYLSKKFSQAFKGEVLIAAKGKPFNLAEQLKLDNVFLKTPTTLKEATTQLKAVEAALGAFETATNAATPKKPVASVRSTAAVSAQAI
jgi:hypothetical protein